MELAFLFHTISYLDPLLFYKSSPFGAWGNASISEKPQAEQILTGLQELLTNIDF